MNFSKTFPRTTKESSYPIWEEIVLSEEEEKLAQEECRRENYFILDESLEEAKSLAIKHGMNTDENRVLIAIALFEKRASHVIFWKENKAKEKFDKTFKH
jgi:hypothetical protein